MDRGGGTLSTLSFLHANRVGAVTPSFKDCFLTENSKHLKEELPFCLGVIPHRNSKDFSFSFSSLAEELVSKKKDIPDTTELVSIQYIKKMQWNESQEFICFHPIFKDKNNEYLPIRLGAVGSIKDSFHSRDPPKRLGHHCAGGDLTLPLQHSYFLIGEVSVAYGSSFIVMNLNSTENLMISVYNPFVPTKVTGMKTTSGKVRIGGAQMQMLFFEEFLSCLYPREVGEKFMSWKLKESSAARLVGKNSSSIDQNKFPTSKEEVFATSSSDFGTHGNTAMDELLAAVTVRENSSDEDTKPQNDVVPDSGDSPSYTKGTHSPLLKEPTFIDIKASHLSYERPDIQEPPPKAAKFTLQQQVTDSINENLLEIDVDAGVDHRKLLAVHIDENSFPSEIPSAWRLASQTISKFASINSIFIRGVNFSGIPPEIEYLENLQFLAAPNNCIRSVPISMQTGNATLPRSLVSLDLSGNDLENFPAADLPELRYLNLQSNRLSSISNSFNMLNSLGYLNVSLNRLTEVPTTLSACTKLGTLILATNSFSTFPSGFFRFFSHLRRLDLSRNQIVSLENTQVSGMEKLRIFDLSFNPLSLIPDCSMLKRLYILRAHYCNLSVINTKLPTSLQVFSIGKNSYKGELPVKLYSLKRLQQLDANHLGLMKISPSITSLQFLQILNVRDNGITVLPPQIVDLKYLIELDISENKFSEFPMEVCSLLCLRALNISSNGLEVLPEQIGQLESLLHLDLSHNKVKQLPSFQTIRQLSQLDVSDNQLTDLHDTIFSLAHLRFLYSSNNTLKSECRQRIKKRFCFK